MQTQLKTLNDREEDDAELEETHGLETTEMHSLEPTQAHGADTPLEPHLPLYVKSLYGMHADIVLYDKHIHLRDMQTLK